MLIDQSVGEFKLQTLNRDVDSAVVVSESAKQWKLLCRWLRGLERLSFQGSFSGSVGGKIVTPFQEEVYGQ